MAVERNLAINAARFLFRRKAELQLLADFVNPFGATYNQVNSAVNERGIGSLRLSKDNLTTQIREGNIDLDIVNKVETAAREHFADYNADNVHTIFSILSGRDVGFGYIDGIESPDLQSSIHLFGFY